MLQLIRHAHAVTVEEDLLRPLSARGREQVAQLVDFFRTVGSVQPAVIWHSPLMRSRETGQRLADGLGFAGPLVEVPHLEPEDDPATIAARLSDAPDGLAIVGHEPHLSGLASLLLTGRAQPAIIVLRKAACLALDRKDGSWRVRWLIDPSL